MKEIGWHISVEYPVPVQIVCGLLALALMCIDVPA